MENIEKKVHTGGKKKGAPKSGGRVKGTPNKVTGVTKEILANIAQGMMKEIPRILSQLEPKDKIKTWLEIVSYIIPKPQKIDVDFSSKQAFTIEARLKELAAENEDY